MIGVLDLMKLLCLFLTLLCAAGSVSCNNETLDDVPIVTENTLDSSDNADTIETADAADSITTTSSDDKVTHTDLIEPPLTEYELSLPVPDFLDAKQQLLYRRAYNVYSHLFGCDPYYAEYAETLDYTPDYMPYEVYIFLMKPAINTDIRRAGIKIGAISRLCIGQSLPNAFLMRKTIRRKAAPDMPSLTASSPIAL